MISRKEQLRLLERLLTPKRLYHSREVEAAAGRLARMHGADVEKAELAGLLHDLCREASPGWMRGYLERRGERLESEWLAHPSIWHGPCAAAYLRHELYLRDKDILRAVRYHTTGRAGMSLLEKVVFLADATSGDRDYFGVDELRELAARDLNAAMLCSLSQAASKVAQMRKPLVSQAVEAYNEYSNIVRAKETENAYDVKRDRTAGC